MLGYRVPAPDEAMLISGARSKRDGTPFRVVTGHGAFVMPFFRHSGNGNGWDESDEPEVARGEGTAPAPDHDRSLRP